MKLNNNDDSHNSGLNLLIYNMLLDIESHPAWVCGLKPLWGIFAPFENLVTPCVGVWIETLNNRFCPSSLGVTPCVGVWIETSAIIRSNVRFICHTLRGCVDWNNKHGWSKRESRSHTLRGCVDWNPTDWGFAAPITGHTLRGCVDWNHARQISLRLPFCHTLRGCVDWNKLFITSGIKRRKVTPCVGVWIETNKW